MIIEDGTGTGFTAGVTSTNALLVQGVVTPELDQATQEGNAFNINTLLATMGAGNTALLRIKNNESTPIVLVNWFIGAVGLTLSSGSPLIEVYGSVTGFSGAETAVPVVNRSVGNARPFLIEAARPSTYPQTLVGAAPTPVLYQTQDASGRVIGAVYITVPRGGSVGVRLGSTAGGGAITGGQLYTGFTGYVVASQFL